MSEDTKLLRRPLPPKTLPALRPVSPARRPAGQESVFNPLPPVQRKPAPDGRTEVMHSCNHASVPFASPVHQAVPNPRNRLAVIPKGPGGFPCRAPRTWPQVHLLGTLQDDPRFCSQPPFTLNDFMGGRCSCPRLRMQTLKQTVFSRENYRKLVELLLAELHRGRRPDVSTQVLSSDSVPVATKRTPQRQIIYELAALIREQVRSQTSAKSSHREDRDSAVGCGSKRVSISGQREALQTLSSSQEHPGSEIILNSVTTRYFQGSRRSQSPFLQDDQCGVIGPSELAILDCLVQGGVLLSLKAHFIARVPDLTPLAHSLLYLNLSFNELNVFPTEVYDIPCLEVLKLRDNPIKEIPDGIHKLSKLKTFVISFCLISALPLGLFSLPCLQFLDVSYNMISAIPSDMRNLRALEYLNVEGNQLAALPCGALRLCLRELRVSNNYMHPYFWTENTQNQPQRLVHLAALCFSVYGLDRRYTSLPCDIQQTLNNVNTCDCCRGPLFGPGLRLIRPCEKIFGVRKVPFLFSACSPSCYESFTTQTENLVQLLYGESASQNS
uniref:Leucine rich repeat containing 63 n=1 Tax=Lepisosteus oculatus TaxID=7918 RepID=W5MWW0_LEPOC|nr:PREDICTED: leucine-rich repeat-containing protein 63 isoform X1 [Lepisosteus oculatus]XP_015219531.1 PREDICTED: leucine-rich repeat-containing protein 63 isoform X1 [Lepisosteus oculatus]XP_015219532.1 PREDICTED: leucine-rich repeat-containing protein 63 isoform X1 [Lepisosteus oculatus]